VITQWTDLWREQVVAVHGPRAEWSVVTVEGAVAVEAENAEEAEADTADTEEVKVAVPAEVDTDTDTAQDIDPPPETSSRGEDSHLHHNIRSMNET
jgi:hypothetical protein